MKLAILFGGTSYEHEISIVSAITLKKVLEGETPLFIFLDFKHEFYLIPSNGMIASHFSSGEYKKEKKLNLIHGGFEYKGLFLKKLFADLRIVNLIHGATGEDGTIFSMLEFNNIKTISPRREASILSYNKGLTKMYANSIGVKVLDYEIISRADRKIKKIAYPLIVKPLNLGSSIGVSVVKEHKDLEYALDVAFGYDNEAIIEPFIEGVRELNLAGTFTNRLQISTIEEPKKGAILDFDAKYLDFGREGSAKSADISKDLRKQMIEAFEKIYIPHFKGSLIRCDFFIINDEVYLNEINSIPGSLANYLFDNFVEILKNIYLPEMKKISPSYKYINKIQKAK